MIIRIIEKDKAYSLKFEVCYFYSIMNLSSHNKPIML